MPSIRTHLQLPIRAAVAAALAVGAAQLLQMPYPLYALVGAVIVTDLSPVQTRKLGGWRMAGTVLGAAVGAALGQVMQGPIAIGLGVLVAMLLSGLLRLRGAAKVSGYVAGIVLLDQSEPVLYALQRLLETALGIAFAMLVSWVPPLHRQDADDRA